jgi:ankyrin repeat protein
VNISTTGGYTLLHEAAERGFSKLAKLIIYAGADVMRRTEKGSTPLLAAASCGRTETVGVILQAGADPNVTNHQGSRALHIACLNGHSGVAEKLVASGADCCAVDDETNNAFHLAAVSGCSEAVCHMLGLESDPGSVPIHCEYNLKHDDRSALVQNLVASVPQDILLATNARNDEQRTPLSIAASVGHASVARVLIRGAFVDVNDENEAGVTPLHLAASEGHHAVIAVLIDEGGAHVNKVGRCRLNL